MEKGSERLGGQDGLLNVFILGNPKSMRVRQ
jgi:hypothetical protein